MPRTKKEINLSKQADLTIDKESIITEIKNEIRKELLQELTIKVEIEAKNKLEKMEKKIYKYKRIAIRKRNIVIILLLLIIAFETKIIYDNNYFSLSNNNNNNNKELSNNEEEKSEIWYIEKYSYLLDTIETNLPEEELKYLYQDNYNETNIKNNIKLNMAYQLLNPKEIASTSTVITIREDSLKESYKKIFGTIDNYIPENFTNNCLQFIYNKNNNNYMAIDISCEEPTIKILENIRTIYEENNNIIIETVVGLYNNENKTLNDIDNTLIIENYSLSNNLNDYEANLNRYKYTFQEIDNNYYLKEIVKLK